MNGINAPISIDVLVLCPFCLERTWVLTMPEHIETHRGEEPVWTENIVPTYFKTQEVHRLNRYEYIECCERARVYNRQAAGSRRVRLRTGYATHYPIIEIADIEVSV